MSKSIHEYAFDSMVSGMEVGNYIWVTAENLEISQLSFNDMVNKWIREGGGDSFVISDETLVRRGSPDFAIVRVTRNK